MKSVFIHGNKEIFKATQLDPEEMAAAFGLPHAPTIQFTKVAFYSNRMTCICD